MTPFRRFLRNVMISIPADIVVLILCGCAATASGQHPSKSLDIFNGALGIIEDNYVEPIDQEKLVQAALNGMLQSLDPHSAFLTPDMYKQLEAQTTGSFGGIGLEVTIINSILTVVSPIEGGPAYKSGIRTGDQILAIDDKPIKDLAITDIVGKLKGPEGSKVRVTIMRKTFKNPRSITLTRTNIKIPSVKYRYLDYNIGYIRISHFQEKTTDEVKQAYGNLNDQSKPTGLILDFRNDPGGLLEEALLLSEFFLKEGQIIVSIKGRDPNNEAVYTAEDYMGKPTCPVIVLVNEGTASAAEIVTGALQDNGRAVIVGMRTFGKGSVQGVIPFEDGSAITLTIALYYTPKGRSIQAEGIVPDVQVESAEQAEKEEQQPTLREKDIAGHMRGEEEPKARHGVNKTNEDLDIARDNQLMVATELLRSWEILKQRVKN